MSIPYFDNLDGRITVSKTAEAYEIFADGELFTMIDNTVTSEEFRQAIEEVKKDLTTTE